MPLTNEQETEGDSKPKSKAGNSRDDYLLRRSDAGINYSDDDTISLESDVETIVTKTKPIMAQPDTITELMTLLLEDQQKD